jgi:hypothetical protein
MKKLVFAAFLIVAMISGANAQTEKGTKLLGGGASFASQDGVTWWSINPSYGSFIKDNLAIGAEAMLGGYDGESNWMLGAYAKPYFGGTENGKFFGKAMLGFGDTQSVDAEFSWGASLGYAAFLNKSVALEFGANYSKIGDFKGVFGLGLGFQIHFKK